MLSCAWDFTSHAYLANTNAVSDHIGLPLCILRKYMSMPWERTMFSRGVSASTRGESQKNKNKIERTLNLWLMCARKNPDVTRG